MSWNEGLSDDRRGYCLYIAIRRCPICIHNAYVDCDNTTPHPCLEDIALIVDLILLVLFIANQPLFCPHTDGYSWALQVVPIMLGFFAYKAAALIQAYRDNKDLLLVLSENLEDTSR